MAFTRSRYNFCSFFAKTTPFDTLRINFSFAQLTSHDIITNGNGSLRLGLLPVFAAILSDSAAKKNPLCTERVFKLTNQIKPNKFGRMTVSTPCMTPFVPCISTAITVEVLSWVSVMTTPAVRSMVMLSPFTVGTAPEGTSLLLKLPATT